MRKQTAASHSSPEAEIVAMDTGVKDQGIPALELWKVILGREPEMLWFEDKTKLRHK